MVIEELGWPNRSFMSYIMRLMEYDPVVDTNIVQLKATEIKDPQVNFGDPGSLLHLSFSKWGMIERWGESFDAMRLLGYACDCDYDSSPIDLELKSKKYEDLNDLLQEKTGQNFDSGKSLISIWMPDYLKLTASFKDESPMISLKTHKRFDLSKILVTTIARGKNHPVRKRLNLAERKPYKGELDQIVQPLEPGSDSISGFILKLISGSLAEVLQTVHKDRATGVRSLVQDYIDPDSKVLQTWLTGEDEEGKRSSNRGTDLEHGVTILLSLLSLSAVWVGRYEGVASNYTHQDCGLDVVKKRQETGPRGTPRSSKLN